MLHSADAQEQMRGDECTRHQGRVSQRHHKSIAPQQHSIACTRRQAARAMPSALPATSMQASMQASFSPSQACQNTPKGQWTIINSVHWHLESTAAISQPNTHTSVHPSHVQQRFHSESQPPSYTPRSWREPLHSILCHTYANTWKKPGLSPVDLRVVIRLHTGSDTGESYPGL